MKLELYNPEQIEESTACKKHHATVLRLKDKTGLGHVDIIHKACEAYEASLNPIEGESTVTIPQALATLRKAMQSDSSLAWSWYCNIAMSIYDGIKDGLRFRTAHREANETAASIMQHLFKVDVQQSAEWKQTFKPVEQLIKAAQAIDSLNAQTKPEVAQSPFKVGDKVRIVQGPYTLAQWSEPHLIGMISIITGESNNYWILDNVCSLVKGTCLELADCIEATKATHKFKVGDTVRTTYGPYPPELFRDLGSIPDRVGIITSIDKSDRVSESGCTELCKIDDGSKYGLSRYLDCIELVEVAV